MKVGFWIRDFHVLQNEVQVMMDLIGRGMRTWVRISRGRESHIASLVNKDLQTLEIEEAINRRV